MKQSISNWWQDVKSGFDEFGKTLRIGWDAIWNGIASFLQGKITEITNYAGNLVANIKNAFNIDWSALGKAIIDGLVNGLMGGVNAVIDAAANVAQSALSAAQGVLGIQSPSKAFQFLGDMSGVGFTAGLSKSLAPQKVNAIMAKSVAGAGDTISRAVNNNIVIHNPKPEPASQSVDGTLKKLSYLGVLR